MDAGSRDVKIPDATVVDTSMVSTSFELLGGDWSLPSGQEGYVCVRRTLEETIYIQEFRPVAPRGTHHTVLTLEQPIRQPDGVVPCNAFSNGPDMIYGSGVGTRALSLPDGVAIKVEAGQQLLLNLHLFNTDSDEISGHSGIEVSVVESSHVEHEAQVILAGKENFLIPARARDYDIHGTCTMTADTTLFATMPHMHTLGTFMEIRATSSAGTQILHEDFYNFDRQRYTTFSPLSLQRGDTVDITCRYDNPSDADVPFGDSTLHEMCYAVLYRYPAVPAPNGIVCRE